MLFLSNRLLLCIPFFLITLKSNSYSQTSTEYLSKKGGVCFRTDDDQPISNYLEYAAIFNRYNKKFSLAINLGMDAITTDYVNSLRQIQTSGHEIMDHTPWHRTNFFYTKLSTDYYINHPGVHRIAGNKVELNHAVVDTSLAKRTGYVNISRDTITSTSGMFLKFSKSDCYLYFPTINELVFIHESLGWIDSNRVKVYDFWLNDIDLGSYQNIKFYNFDYNNIHLSIDAIKALGEETLRLSNYYNLERPFSCVQPGGYHPQFYKNELKQALGDELGYKGAGVFNEPSLKVFNEYNPNNDKQFGMNYGDFRDDNWTLTQCKALIADRIAKHRVVFGETHFNYSIGGLLGGWTGFLGRTEKLLQWCIASNVPVRTYSEWADVLYNQVPNPNENIFPPLNVDLDSNNVPDGYDSTALGTLKKNDGYPSSSNYCYTINKVGQICSISGLGGIEKGYNEFEIYTKGDKDDYIEVTIKVGTQDLIYKFPATSSSWKKYNLSQSVNGNTSLYIPVDVSLINISIKCSNYSKGEVRISNMKLAKSLSGSAYLNIDPTFTNVLSQSGSCTFNVYSNINWSVTEDANWVTVLPTSILNDGIITATYTENSTDSQRVATITVTGGNLTKILTITQERMNRLEVTPTEQYVVNTAGSTFITTNSNVNWTVSDNAPWLTLSTSSGLDNDTIYVTYTSNGAINQRTGTITFTGGGITKVATMTQQGGDVDCNCPSNMISLWKFNDTTNSKYVEIYNGIDGQIGTNAPTPTKGIISGGQLFDGIDDEINIPANSLFDFLKDSSFSVEFWFKHPNTLTGNEVIIGRDDASTQLHWWVGLNTQGKTTFYLISTSGQSYNAIGTKSLIDSTWHQIVAVRDAGANQLRIYVDGALEKATYTTYTSGFNSATANLNIGWLNLSNGFHFKGAIDEVAIYGKVLSQSEIQNHYEAGLAGLSYCDYKVSLAATLLLEGAYNSIKDSMNTLINDYIPKTSPYTQDPRTVSTVPQNVVDWLLIELKSDSSSSSAISRSVFLHRDGNIVADDGIKHNIWMGTKPGNYYLIIKHRNSIETWSTNPLVLSPEGTSYNFTFDSSKAYGNNMVKIGNKWCIYAGDINQDNIIDGADVTNCFNASNSGLLGYIITDITGDGFVDGTDVTIVLNNSNSGINALYPFLQYPKIQKCIINLISE